LKETQDNWFGFERLEVWKRAVAFANRIYQLTKSFPREEMFGLTMQLRRAGVSVAANIAEGASRSSRKDQARFFEVAYGSLNEVATMLRIATDQGWIPPDTINDTRHEIAELGSMLSGLRRSALGGGF